jgi:membrane-associated phospholipid phosphatase
MNAILDLGIHFIAGVQTSTPWLEAPSWLFSFLGTERFYLFLLPFLYWCVDIRLGLRIGVILTLSDCLNTFLKFLFHQPRPYWISDKVRVIQAEPSYGLPSGHAQHAVTVWGTVAAWCKGWVRWLMAVLIFLIGFSRIVLAVHFPTDVLAGWLIGGVILWFFLRCEAGVIPWFNRLNLSQKIGLAFGASILLIIISLTGLAFVPPADPSLWKTDVTRAFSLALDHAAIRLRVMTGAVGVGGMFFGLVAGAILIFQRGGLDTRDPWSKRALRFALGMIGVLILWLGLTMVLPRDASFVSQVLRYVRYALTGFWVAYVAPLIFIKLGLQNTAKVPEQSAPR